MIGCINLIIVIFVFRCIDMFYKSNLINKPVSTEDSASSFYEVLGRGMADRNVFEQGDIRITSGAEHVNQSVRHILQTPYGTRFFMPEFGSLLFRDMFMPADTVIQNEVESHTRQALEKWEPRIEVLDVSTRIDNAILYLSVSYKILALNKVEHYSTYFNLPNEET